ncbi:MAG: hypothetical protein WBG32_09105 [Nodosilinea sp.]
MICTHHRSPLMDKGKGSRIVALQQQVYGRAPVLGDDLYRRAMGYKPQLTQPRGQKPLLPAGPNFGTPVLCLQAAPTIALLSGPCPWWS